MDDAVRDPSGIAGTDVGADALVDAQLPLTPPAFSSRGREEGLAFARRMHGPRALGLGLGFLCIASVLYQHGANAVT